MNRTPSATVLQFPKARHVHAGDAIVIVTLPPLDYADTRFDPYAGLERQARQAAVEADTRRDLRVRRWQAIIRWACIGIALGTVAYFVAEFAR